jgi:kynurenine formamidase
VSATPEALNNWGAFGEGDELGTLNYLTPAAVLRGAQSIRTGERFPLSLPLDLPTGRHHGRPELEKVAFRHNASIYGLVANDDYVVLALQGSTQWDSFVHCGVQEDGVDGVFYNGVDTDAVDEHGFAHRNGIDKVAQVGIAGRGLLLDVARMVTESDDGMLDPEFSITEDVVRACVDAQGVAVEPGDVICFRTGWTERYLAGDDELRLRMFGGEAPMVSAGIAPSLAGLAAEQRWAAVAADNPAVESTPMPHGSANAHITMQRNLGILFGELFLFGDLARAAAADGRYDFLFVSTPLWIPGAMGSPANALAIR